MSNDLWSYRGVLLRGLLVLPLFFICFVSKRFSDKYRERIDAFVWGY